MNQVLNRLENYFDKVILANHWRPHFFSYVSFSLLIGMQFHMYEDHRRIGHTRPKKGFKSQKIHFDFGILISLKELMVDVPSNCMEVVLKVFLISTIFKMMLNRRYIFI